jgi:hypothetical protein
MNSTGTGNFVSNLSGLIAGTYYYIRAYATNSYGTSYGPEKNFTTSPPVPGDNYLGGKVAYVLQPGDPGYDPNLIKGLIVATSDQSTGTEWGCTGTTIPGADGSALGTGNQNTFDIMAGCASPGIAARICGDLVLNGYDDWYLPSKDELNKLYLNGVAIGGFSSDLYWSSSEIGPNAASAQYFFNGGIGTFSKSVSSRVRAIRSFPSAPIITTTAVGVITVTSAICGGNLTGSGGAEITARGVCWSTSPNPTLADYFTSESPDTGAFSSTISGLDSLTTYHVRAYATNGIGTAYGNEISFTTLGLPILTTVAVNTISGTKAQSGGNISNDGGSPVTAYGICWSMSPNPTIADNFTNDGSGTGIYSSNITGLDTSVTYYVRAYATNSLGTGYGIEVSFTTASSYSIGDAYLGGILAYYLQPGDSGYDANVPHGLIAAPYDQSSSAPWGCTGLATGATNIAIGSGYSNTLRIVDSCATPGIAARICNDLILNGYSDWFLPSRHELYKVLQNQALIGGFNDPNYWCSYESGPSYAYYVTIPPGFGNVSKSWLSSVRAIRYF